MKTYLNKFILLCISMVLLMIPASASQDSVYACYLVDNYDYSIPVMSSDMVSDEYFDDALFIGDSRMGGFSLFSEIENREVYYIESLFINKLDVTLLEDGETLMDKIRNTDKHNLYLMLGLNESGWQDFSLFANALDSLIKQIKEIHSDMNIYVFMLYTPESTTVYDENQIHEVIYYDNISILKVCYENQVYALDMNPYLIGDNMVVKDEYTHDGIHLNKKGVQVMEEFIKTHVAKEEIYVKKICN